MAASISFFPDLPADAGEKLQILSGTVARKKARCLDDGANTLRRFDLFPNLFSIHKNRAIVHPEKSADAFEQYRLPHFRFFRSFREFFPFSKLRLIPSNAA